MTTTSDLPHVVIFTKDAQPTVYRDNDPDSQHRVDIDTISDGVVVINNLRRRFMAAVDILLFGMTEARIIHSNDLSVEAAQQLNDDLIDKLYHPDGVFVGDMHSDAWFEEEGDGSSKD